MGNKRTKKKRGGSNADIGLPTEADILYFNEIRNKYFPRGNAGLPLDIAPKGKSSNRSRSRSSNRPRSRSSNRSSNRPRDILVDQPHIQRLNMYKQAYADMSPAQKRKLKQSMLKSKRKFSRARLSNKQPIYILGEKKAIKI